MSFTSSLGKRARTVFAPTSEYEEGSWTPVLKYSSTTVTAAISTGYYVRIGNMVTVTAYFGWTTDITGGGTAALFIDNMPFASRADNQLTAGCVSSHALIANAAADTMALAFPAATASNQATFYWQYVRSSLAPLVVQANQTAAAGTKYLAFSFSYPTSGYTF